MVRNDPFAGTSSLEFRSGRRVEVAAANKAAGGGPAAATGTAGAIKQDLLSPARGRSILSRCQYREAKMKGVCRQLFAGLLALLTCASVATVSAQQEPKRTITPIVGDLYRFQDRFHFSVFLVTPEGVIATDPINPDAASWLKDEIARRFGKPVRYLIYSHDHADHISGGEVFADTAVVVAHENAKAVIVGEKRPTAVPTLTFSDRMAIELGGKTVELAYVGRSHSDNMIVMNFPEERALFAVDFISVKSLPYRTLTDAYFPDWIEAVKRVEAMDFDILVPGHGPIGVKADASRHRAYLEDLYAAVLAAARAGQSLEEMQRSIKLEKYRDWSQYEAWLPLNIEGVYRQISLHRRGN
jgi:glyoxylase-like metal-dependent hydrolase (beta-lactamase superfamily II)